MFMQGSCALLLHADRRINACQPVLPPLTLSSSLQYTFILLASKEMPKVRWWEVGQQRGHT